MQKIKFNGNDKVIDVELSSYDQNRIKCVFHSDKYEEIESYLRSGFKELNEYNFKIQGDYSSMKYIYHQPEENIVIFTSDENDIYIETGEFVECKENIIPVQHVPNLDEEKQKKISELSSICTNFIFSGVDVLIDDNIEHFSYNEKDQINIKELYDRSSITNSNEYYHADKQSYKLYSAEQIKEIYFTQSLNKMHHLIYFNQLKLYVNSLNDIDTITNIMYGQELTDEYLDLYNEAISHFKENTDLFSGADG